MTSFEEVDEFKKEIKKLNKKFKSIYTDLVTFKKALIAELPKPPRGTVRVSRLGQNVKIPIYKVRHFRCKSLKGRGVRSGIRIIYAHNEKEDKVIFIEIYYKDGKKNEDRERILKYFQER